MDDAKLDSRPIRGNRHRTRIAGEIWPQEQVAWHKTEKSGCAKRKLSLLIFLVLLFVVLVDFDCDIFEADIDFVYLLEVVDGFLFLAHDLVGDA